jgi:hypothetical protein
VVGPLSHRRALPGWRVFPSFASIRVGHGDPSVEGGAARAVKNKVYKGGGKIPREPAESPIMTDQLKRRHPVARLRADAGGYGHLR